VLSRCGEEWTTSLQRGESNSRDVLSKSLSTATNTANEWRNQFNPESQNTESNVIDQFKVQHNRNKSEAITRDNKHGLKNPIPGMGMELSSDSPRGIGNAGFIPTNTN